MLKSSNVLHSILNIVDNKQNKVSTVSGGKNKINDVGEGLEDYIQQSFVDNYTSYSKPELVEVNSEVFSYLGSKNNPPDLILRNGDAVEVKKIAVNNSIALNSSPPKHKLSSTDTRLTKACRDCESSEWQEKDIIYAIGTVKNEQLEQLFYIYGDCYAASGCYENLATKIQQGVMNIPDVEFSKTKELGKIKKIDPLGITDLRIRGMWHIENPMKVFSYVYAPQQGKNFNLCCIMRKDKFLSFGQSEINRISHHQSIMVSDIKIKNPDNPAKLIDSILITYHS